MQQTAYDLDRFAPPQSQVAKVKVAKKTKRRQSARALQIWRTSKFLLSLSVLVFLVSAVLYTQAAVTEVTTQIADKKQELKEEEALNTHLSFELDNKTSLRSIEERAKEMGLAKAKSEQIVYFRVEDGANISVKEGFFASTWHVVKELYTGAVAYFKA